MRFQVLLEIQKVAFSCIFDVLNVLKYLEL